MKLELKHIAPYLPYELTCQCMGQVKRNGDPIIFDIVGAFQEWLHIAELESPVHDEISYEDTFPILRPLSDLTKEIEHNKEKIIPTIFLKWNCGNDTDFSDILIWGNWVDLEFCFKHNFDVFGLIEGGLAIDLNTLYKKES